MSDLTTGFLFFRKTAVIMLMLFVFPSLAENSGIEREKITQKYFEGDFAGVIKDLELHRKSGNLLDKTDSIFVFKYLSVVYAANSETRLKGESYMYQLLNLLPSVDLLDMYVSDKIQGIFNKVKAEYLARKKSNTTSPQAQDNRKYKPDNKTAALASTPPKEQHSSSKRWIWWTAGGVTVAGTVAAFVLLNGDDPTPQPRPSFSN